MPKVKACVTSEVPKGTMKNFNLMDRTVLIVNLDGKYFAMDGICSHQGGNLSQGRLRGFVVKCPRHGSEFDIRTGKNLKGPWVPFGRAYDLRAYPVTEEEGCLMVDL